MLSTGDIFTPDHYPVFNPQDGGSLNGTIDALNRMLEIIVPQDNEEGGTYVIPGHGRVCDITDVANYRDMVTIIRDRILDMVKKGMTFEEVKAAKPTFDYDVIYGSDTGPWATNTFIEAAYRELSKSAGQARAGSAMMTGFRRVARQSIGLLSQPSALCSGLRVVARCPGRGSATARRRSRRAAHSQGRRVDRYHRLLGSDRR